ncbi:entericidin A/B family lipoprotein [Limnobacter sp.]
MKFISAVMLALSAMALSACNTIEGMGKDIKAGGAAIERAADENKR